MAAGKVREAKYAGSFYPKDKHELSQMVLNLMSKSKPKKVLGKVKALIVPHAGYVYSGEVAAKAYTLLKERLPKRVILLGPAHHDYVDGVYSFEGYWATPIGKTRIHKSGLGVITGDSEHSLEVQLPFLQTIFKDADFEFIPLIYGANSPDLLAQICVELSNEDTVIIASSDLSHFFSYALAKKVDGDSINSILSLDFKKFLETGDACGKTGIASLLMLAKKNNWKPVLIEYKNSGDTAGDKASVVGYLAVAFIK
jgi:MEMO1 family protein